jgi:hypothetical protein
MLFAWSPSARGAPSDSGWTVDVRTGVVTTIVTQACDETLASETVFISAEQPASDKGDPKAEANGSYAYTCDGPAPEQTVALPLETTVGRFHAGLELSVIGVVQCRYADATHNGDVFCYGGSGTTVEVLHPSGAVSGTGAVGATHRSGRSDARKPRSASSSPARHAEPLVRGGRS